MTAAKEKRLSALTFREIEQEIARLPAVILPLGGCEPLTEHGALGAASACAEAIAARVSETLQLLVAPAIMYGCSTPYGAFGGCAGIKPRTLTNTLCELVRLWYLQGFRIVIIVDGLFDNGEAVALAERRLKNTNPAMKLIPFSLQRDERIRAFIGKHLHEHASERTEYGILSMAAHIDPKLVRAPAPSTTQPPKADAQRLRNWRKRGADPQQYRKFFPSCSSGRLFDADFGRALFEFILQVITDTVAPFSIPPHPEH